jgi:hypothetical protein
VQTHSETYLKNIDTKLTTILTLPILAQDVQVETNNNLFATLADFFARIKQNQYNLSVTRSALALLGIIPTSRQSTY